MITINVYVNSILLHESYDTCEKTTVMEYSLFYRILYDTHVSVLEIYVFRYRYLVNHRETCFPLWYLFLSSSLSCPKMAPLEECAGDMTMSPC